MEQLRWRLHQKITRTTIAVVMMIVVASCAPTWSAADRSDDDVANDTYACQREAIDSVGRAPGGGGVAINTAPASGGGWNASFVQGMYTGMATSAASTAAVDYDRRIDELATLCMRAKGYRRDVDVTSAK